MNLRNWDNLGKGPVTEQIYVHSKLVIADDRCAILGSANINDRSLLGDRDSEIALYIKDSTPAQMEIPGGKKTQVSKGIHNLRVKLWRKHFGLASGNLGKIGSAKDVYDHLKGGEMAAWLPFEEAFWRTDEERKKKNSEGE